jgi:DNA-binding GntR family transcriptional regulator
LAADPIVLPVEPTDDSDVRRVHDRLRSAILTGELRPNEPISQVRLARTYGVSRTPLREALRLLEREGLILPERHRSARVAALGVADLEQIYALRITLECFGIQLSARLLDAAELDAARGELDAMTASAAADDFDAYERHHRAFHLALVQHGGLWLTTAVAQLRDYSERYRRVYSKRFRPHHTAAEHAPILDAIARQDGPGASRLLAGHLARAALTLMASEDPAYDPVAVRTALRIARGDAAEE